MLDLIVSVPDHCLSFYFTLGQRSLSTLGKQKYSVGPTLSCYLGSDA